MLRFLERYRNIAIIVLLHLLVITVRCAYAKSEDDSFETGQSTYAQKSAQHIQSLQFWANKGSAPEQTHLGVCYFIGEGVTKNITEAVRLLRLAANKRFRDTKYFLALIYLDGEEVPRDIAEAAKLLQLEMMLNSEIERLSQLYCQYEHMIPPSQYLLKMLDWQGDNVPKDLSEIERILNFIVERLPSGVWEQLEIWEAQDLLKQKPLDETQEKLYKQIKGVIQKELKKQTYFRQIAG